ncbi:hypothetical protein SLEP1_g52646 [Rubroshorea leprosula]|uniref:Uncharacterized protein n=1 Tax=Rubroshorea leprosula TaxID=152421 RepID=A0AAV5M975_9ROSI|nr:hypothetical protein SLEP1_g52646 [Rubroshorea leprosula]
MDVGWAELPRKGSTLAGRCRHFEWSVNCGVRVGFLALCAILVNGRITVLVPDFWILRKLIIIFLRFSICSLIKNGENLT